MKLEQPSAERGFTLIEMLIVIAIVLLISSVMLPVALSALGEQEISGAASTVQAAFSLTRDQATREGRPVGIRLLPDPAINDPYAGRVASNRILVLKVPANHSEGQAHKANGEGDPAVLANITWAYIARPGGLPPLRVQRIVAVENKIESVAGLLLPASPTSWYSNIRQGEKLTFGDAGNEYIVAGPTYLYRDQEGYDINRNSDPTVFSTTVVNPERFVYGDLNNDPSDGIQSRSLPNNGFSEYLTLVNGHDDDGDGYIDEGFDGVNNNNDFYPAGHPLAGAPIIDPGYNGIDDDLDRYVDELDELVLFHNGTTFVYDDVLGEYEPEDFRGPVVSGFEAAKPYTIERRPLPSPDGRDIQLPGNAVIDLSSSNLGFQLSERSKVPYDPNTGYVEFLIYPNGRITPSNHTGNYTSMADFPFYFLWIAEREDVREPLWGMVSSGTIPAANPAAASTPAFSYRYGMPRGTPYYLDHDNDGQVDPAFAEKSGSFLEGERRMVVVSPRSGHASVTPLVAFDARNINAVFGEASKDQSGGRPTGQ